MTLSVYIILIELIVTSSSVLRLPFMNLRYMIRVYKYRLQSTIVFCMQNGNYACKIYYFHSCIIIYEIGLTCPELSPPENGFKIGDGTSIGYTVLFSCRSGFDLNGNSSSQCLENGQWSNPVASCEGRLKPKKLNESMNLYFLSIVMFFSFYQTVWQ